MEVLSQHGGIVIRGRKPQSFSSFLFIMAREAVEPIALTIGLSLLFYRLQSSMDTAQQTGKDLLPILFSDVGERPMIYVLIILIGVAWWVYKAWKVREDKIRDRTLIDSLEKIQKTLDEMHQTIKVKEKYKH